VDGSLIRKLGGAWAGLLLAALAGCGPVNVKPDPSTFPVPADAAAQLRGKQSVALNNAYPSETVATIFSGAVEWHADLRQCTETAITLLGEEMTKKGIELSPTASKKITLRVLNLHAGPSAFVIKSSLTLEVLYGDGAKSVIVTENSSPADAHRAVSGAIMYAVTRLLRDERFLAYANR
jgi:hypothetical protein